MRKMILRIAIWLIKHCGYTVRLLAVDDRLLAAARIAIAEAERVSAGAKDHGLYKRQQAMRMLSNMMPKVSEHDCANAVQVALDMLKHGAR